MSQEDQSPDDIEDQGSLPVVELFARNDEKKASTLRQKKGMDMKKDQGQNQLTNDLKKLKKFNGVKIAKPNRITRCNTNRFVY